MRSNRQLQIKNKFHKELKLYQMIIKKKIKMTLIKICKKIPEALFILKKANHRCPTAKSPPLWIVRLSRGNTQPRLGICFHPLLSSTR